MAKIKIVVQLSGGLGNQMFQYAAGRALALASGAELVLDTWSGFVRDDKYKNQYELGVLPIAGRRATNLERLPFWLYRFENKFVRYKGRVGGDYFVQQRWYGCLLDEGTCCRYLKEFWEEVDGGNVWLTGYWQSPCYFESHAHILRKELMPFIPKQSHYLEIGKQMRGVDSVALGIRLYEESSNPGAHARNGRIKGVTEINSAIVRLQSEKPSARFYVFCTHHSSLFAEFNLPKDTVYVIPEEGFCGTVETLWLLAQCRHHIFTNSSYYWWGAWLSAAIHLGIDGGQRIFAADNFINLDGLCSEWETY